MPSLHPWIGSPWRCSWATRIIASIVVHRGCEFDSETPSLDCARHDSSMMRQAAGRQRNAPAHWPRRVLEDPFQAPIPLVPSLSTGGMPSKPFNLKPHPLLLCIAITKQGCSIGICDCQGYQRGAWGRPEKRRDDDRAEGNDRPRLQGGLSRVHDEVPLRPTYDGDLRW